MVGAIAMQTKENVPILYPREFKRSRTAECENDALATLDDYKHWGQISAIEHTTLKKRIEAAPHNDAISDIMTRLRKRVYG